jgi:hypothetical protein
MGGVSLRAGAEEERDEEEKKEDDVGHHVDNAIFSSALEELGQHPGGATTAAHIFDRRGSSSPIFYSISDSESACDARSSLGSDSSHFEDRGSYKKQPRMSAGSA